MATRTDIITFPEFNSFNDTLQYILTVSYDDTVTSTNNYTASDFNLLIEQYGSQEADYRIDERLLIPNQIEITILDPSLALDSKFFDEENVTAQLQILLNGEDDYNGELVTAPLISMANDRKIVLLFSSSIDILNKTMVVDSDGNYTAPIDFSDITITAPNGQSVIKVKDAIKRMYQFINPAVEFEFYHDWTFYGFYEENDQSPQYVIEDGTFDELYVKPITIYLGAETLADALKIWCERFFAKTGMIKNNKAFFRKLYHYDSANLQTLKILDKKKIYKYSTISYFKVANADGSPAYELPSSEAFTTAEGEYDEISYWWDPDKFFIIRNGIAYTLNTVRDPALAGTNTIPTIAANLFYNRKSVAKYNREDELTIYGINVDYAKNFLDGNSMYEISSMKKNNAEGYTNVKAMYLGEVS